MTKLELYSDVVLTRDFPEFRLKQGDIATLIEFLDHPAGGEEGCILEVFNVLGESIDVITVPLSAVAPLRADQVPSARTLAQTA
jgi:hypothetical protein